MFERVVIACLTVLSVLVVGSHLLKSSECAADDRLIGRIVLSPAVSSSAWWGITRAGMKSSGVNVDDAEAVLEVVNIWLAAEHKELNAAIDELLENVRLFDANDNGFVCAYEVKGSRRTSGEPFARHYVHGFSDDRDDGR